MTREFEKKHSKRPLFVAARRKGLSTTAYVVEELKRFESISEVANAYNVSRQVVHYHLREARRLGIIDSEQTTTIGDTTRDE